MQNYAIYRGILYGKQNVVGIVAIRPIQKKTIKSINYIIFFLNNKKYMYNRKDDSMHIHMYYIKHYMKKKITEII